jgi:hypothetical protein
VGANETNPDIEDRVYKDDRLSVSGVISDLGFIGYDKCGIVFLVTITAKSVLMKKEAN